jgi:hypothetical protein
MEELMIRKNNITHFERVKYLINQQIGVNLYEKVDKLNTEKLATKAHITKLLEKALSYQYVAFMKKKYPDLWDFLCSHMAYTYPFYINDQKVFEFDQNITQLFLRTHLDDVDESQIQFPFDSFYIKVPSKFFPLGRTKDGRLCYIEGIYVNQAFIPDSPYSHERAMSAAAVLFPYNEEITSETVVNDYEYFAFPIYRGGNIYNMINDFVNEGDHRFDEELHRLFSFIFNALLYINSDKAVIERIKTEHIDTSKIRSTKKRKRAERNNKKYSELEHHYVGHIIIDNRLRVEIEREEKSRSESKKTYQSQWIVRGHWRNQAYGENHSKRKLIWVKPYIKGNVSQPLVNKKYKVK